MIRYKATQRWRRMLRQLNQRGLFLELNPSSYPALVVAGYTRSGTRYFAGILSSILNARYIYEPLEPECLEEVSFFHPRESATTITGNAKYLAALRSAFGPGFKGTKEYGHNILYSGDRIVKVVRANFYLHILSQLFPETGFCVIIRNPASAVASRIRQGWEVPDHSKCLIDIEKELTHRQKKAIWESSSIHERIAVSWCLDITAALKNMGNRKFAWIYYENLVMDPFRQITAVLKSANRRVPDRRVRREIEFYSGSAPRNTGRMIKGWEGVLNPTEVEEIVRIVDIFDLSYLYDFDANIPSNAVIGAGNPTSDPIVSEVANTPHSTAPIMPSST